METFTPVKKIGLLPFEYVMPISGRFARIDSIEFSDVLDAFQSQGPLYILLSRLVVNVCSIDGEGAMPGDWAAMPYEDVAPAIQFLHNYWYKTHGASR